MASLLIRPPLDIHLPADITLRKRKRIPSTEVAYQGVNMAQGYDVCAKILSLSAVCGLRRV
jgi:hypothetical protein